MLSSYRNVNSAFKFTFAIQKSTLREVDKTKIKVGIGVYQSARWSTLLILVSRVQGRRRMDEKSLIDWVSAPDIRLTGVINKREI